jgi:hypothetical protein
MIGQYLPNNNEKRYRVILPKKFGSKPALTLESWHHATGLDHLWLY